MKKYKNETQLTLVDIFKVDSHMLVPVTPGLLMVEAQSVEKFMLNDTVVNTTVPVERDHLSASCPAKVRVAPEKDGRNNDRNVYNMAP